jgi:hypothetical protein
MRVSAAARNQQGPPQHVRTAPSKPATINNCVNNAEMLHLQRVYSYTLLSVAVLAARGSDYAVRVGRFLGGQQNPAFGASECQEHGHATGVAIQRHTGAGITDFT